MTLHFDRTVSTALLAELQPDGRLHSLVRRAKSHPAADIQLRRARNGDGHATLYIGLTSVLDVHEHNGKVWLTAHRTHQRRGGFDTAWHTRVTLDELAASWPSVEAYLARLIDSPGNIDARHFSKEGLVQSVMAFASSHEYGAIQREAVLWSKPSPDVGQLRAAAATAACLAITSTGRKDTWWPGVRDNQQMPSIGDELDILAVDRDGRLLAVEVKPADEVKGIVFSPAQVFVYADLFARWLEEKPAAAADSLKRMAAQRVTLGLLPERWLTHTAPTRVAPIVAIGAGNMSNQALVRLADVAIAVAKSPHHPLVDPLEVWLLNAAGEPTLRWLPSQGPPPAQHVPKPPAPKMGTAVFAEFAGRADAALSGHTLFIGRQGGLHGAPFRGDVETGAWRTFAYRVEAAAAAPNRNWFSLAAFLAAVGETAA